MFASFFAPLPLAARDGGPASLPPIGAVLGGESTELRSLREDASQPEGGTSRATMRPRTALFCLGPQGEIPARNDRFVRPAGLRRPDILMRDDPAIDHAVHHLTSDVQARERFVSALRRSGRFAPEISRIARAWKLPEILVSVAFVESAFQASAAPSEPGRDARPSPSSIAPLGAPSDAPPGAGRPRESPAVPIGENASGLWQMTPEVAHVYGLSMLLSYDERRGISSGTEAAMRYLADLRERLGSWELALVAFAMGYGPTAEAVAKHGSTDFWVLAPSMPPSAAVYVAQVMGTAVVLANLDRFGLETVKPFDPVSLSELEVPSGTSLPLVARAASVSPATLRELNPEYGSDIVPTSSFPMVVHVPSDTLARARSTLPFLQEGSDAAVLSEGADGGVEAPSAPPPQVISRGTDRRIFYRVREGDTLPALAREYGSSLETLASDNALDATSSLRPGMILAIRLPDAPAVPSSSLHKAPPKPPNHTIYH